MRDYKLTDLYPYTKTLSSSMVILYFKDPYSFWKEYVKPYEERNGTGIFGEPERKVSPALAFGLAFSELYADRKFEYKAYCKKYKVSQRLIDYLGNVIKFFREPCEPEKELYCRYKKWKFRATLDDFYHKLQVIVENKTGALLWTQEVADEHIQITLQQWVFWKLFKLIPKYTILNYVDTTTAPKVPVETFITKRNKAQLMMFEMEVIDKVIAGIEAKDWTPNPNYRAY